MKLTPTSSSSSLGLYKPAPYTVLFLWSDSTARIQRKCKRQKKFISELKLEESYHHISYREESVYPNPCSKEFEELNIT